MPSISRTLHALRETLLRRSFAFWQKLGVHVLPNHFYTPVPDTSKLDEDLWKPRGEVPGLDLNEEGQLETLANCAAFRQEYEQFSRLPTGTSHQFYLRNKMFESVDAEMLYCMIRRRKPRRIVEVGSGFSTLVAARAIERNREDDARCDCRLVAIEPYPNDTLRSGFAGLDSLIELPLQKVPLSTFTDLETSDILFIDSSHVLKIGSDVQTEILEILPKLGKGVLVHFHDIFLPNEYPLQWVKSELRFFNEQYVLQAFLAFNSSFRVLWGSAYMHSVHSEKLAAAFSSYDPKGPPPGSFWIERIA